MEDNFEPVSRSSELINADNCFIMVIDVQSAFMQGLSKEEQLNFIQKFTHLIKLSHVLNIPLIVTAENLEENGSLPNTLLDILPSSTKIYDKFVYSCWGQNDIQLAIKDTHRQIAVLCGFETDVCVAQTAIDLQANGFQVVILTDITFSRNNVEHEIGLSRMEHHGVIFSLLKTWQEEISAGVKTIISQVLKENQLNSI
ncbi:MAG: isochorismatase family protein [Promethearchaeota archaeon]